MKYFIQINQIVLSQYKSLDIKDAAILDYLRAWCQADDKKVRQLSIKEGGVEYKYNWINFKYLIEEMPLLKIKDKGAISRRIEKLEKTGLIKTFRAPDMNLYVRLTEKIKEIEFDNRNNSRKQNKDKKLGVDANQRGVDAEQHLVLTQNNSTNNILIKHNNHNTNTSILSKDNIEEETSPKKTAKDNFSEEMKTLFLRAKEILNIQNWADTQKWNRIYASHCLKKWGLEKTLRSLEEIKKTYDREYYPNSFKDIYYTIARLENRKHREKTRRTIFIGHRDKDKTR
jgi:hypothetical protein